MKIRIYSLYWDLIDLLFPPTCGGCKKPGVRWCETCQQQTPKIQLPICEICGQNIKEGHQCYRCLRSLPHLKAVRSWAEFDRPVWNAIHDLKYRENIGLGISLANHLVQLFTKFNWAIDLVTPVPLGRERITQRGYNQADILARPLAYSLQLPYNPRTLTRIRETQSQVELSLPERKNNMKGAFNALRQHVQDKNIIVVDDVTTSGSTLEACAKALLEAGAKSVYGLTVARAVLKN